MARTQAPLMSLDASGSIASTLTFAKWKGRNYVRELVIPSNPNSAKQQGVRATFKFITQIFGSLSASIKSHWADAAKVDNITALNEMVRQNQARQVQDFGMLQDPTLAPGAVEAAPTAGAAAPLVKELKLTWVDSVGADDWCTEIYRSTTNGFTPGPSNLVAVIAKGVQLWFDTPLVSGTVYYYRIRGNEKGGTAGTLAAQFSGTPT